MQQKYALSDALLSALSRHVNAALGAGLLARSPDKVMRLLPEGASGMNASRVT